jgi:carboxypeptidase Q
MPEFMRKPAGPLALKPEQKLISAYFNVDNGTGKIRGIYTQGNAAVDTIFAQWMAPLKDLGVTTITNRNTGGTDHYRLMPSASLASSSSRIHGLRDPHPPFQYGYL